MDTKSSSSKHRDFQLQAEPIDSYSIDKPWSREVCA